MKGVRLRDYDEWLAAARELRIWQFGRIMDELCDRLERHGLLEPSLYRHWACDYGLDCVWHKRFRSYRRLTIDEHNELHSILEPLAIWQHPRWYFLKTEIDRACKRYARQLQQRERELESWQTAKEKLVAVQLILKDPRRLQQIREASLSHNEASNREMISPIL